MADHPDLAAYLEQCGQITLERWQREIVDMMENPPSHMTIIPAKRETPEATVFGMKVYFDPALPNDGWALRDSDTGEVLFKSNAPRTKKGHGARHDEI